MCVSDFILSTNGLFYRIKTAFTAWLWNAFSQHLLRDLSTCDTLLLFCLVLFSGISTANMMWHSFYTRRCSSHLCVKWHAVGHNIATKVHDAMWLSHYWVELKRAAVLWNSEEFHKNFSKRITTYKRGNWHLNLCLPQRCTSWCAALFTRWR